MNPLKVCIVGLKCYDHLIGTPVPRYLGGIETQLAILAKGLVGEGCNVSIITYDHGQPDGEVFGGVRVFKSHRPEAGIPLLRWLHPRSTRLWSAMRRADADVFLQMGAGSETGQVAWGCRRQRKKFMFCLASDANFGAHLRAGRFGWEGKVYQYGLRQADLIVAQTLRQQHGLRQALALHSEVIPMAAIPPVQHSAGFGSRLGSDRVLWVGRITPGKRLEWLLEAARRCPDIAFDVVGTPNKASPYATGLLDDAACLSNVRVHGRLAGTALSKLYQDARLLCCTSLLEGFPTTFLEAWSRALPVVTTFDPDGVVARHGLGRVAHDQVELVSHLRDVLGNANTHSRLSKSAQRYYLEHHTVEAVSRRFCLAFEQLLFRGAPGGSSALSRGSRDASSAMNSLNVR